MATLLWNLCLKFNVDIYAHFGIFGRLNGHIIQLVIEESWKQD